MSNVIKTIVDKKTGRPITNVQVVKDVYYSLLALQEGESAVTNKEKDEMFNTFYKVTNGSENAEKILKWCKSIIDCEAEQGYDAAQKLLSRTLLGLDLPAHTPAASEKNINKQRR